LLTGSAASWYKAQSTKNTLWFVHLCGPIKKCLIQEVANVKYKKDILEYPIKVKDQNDFQPGTRVPKLAKTPIWLVEIVMPKKLMQEINQGSLELESGTVDVEEMESAYEEGLDDNMYKTDAQAPAQAAQGI
jgi:hypothetical protein